MFRRLLTLAALAAATTASAYGAEGLRPLLAPRCQQIAKSLLSKKESNVGVLTKGPEKSLPNARPADVERLFKEELGKLGIKVSDDARYQLAVDYTDATRDRGGILRPFELKLTLKEAATEKPVQAFDVTVEDQLLLRRLGGDLASPLEAPLCELARRLAVWLETQAENKLAFTGLHGPDGEAAGIAKRLLDELGRQKNKKGDVRVDPAAALRLRGACEVTEADGGRAAIVLRVEVVNRLGKRVGEEMAVTIPLSGKGAEATRDVDGIATLVAAAPETGTFPPDQPTEKRVAAYLGRRKRPTASVEGGAWVKPDRSSPFAVALRVEGKLVPAEVKGGQAFVSLKKGDKYEVMVRSTLKHDTAFATALDGLSMFAFSENKNYTHLILPKGKKECAVTGWHKVNDKVDRFQVQPLADTPAGRLIRSGPGIGTVTVLFSAAWGKGEPIPDDEELFKARSRGGEKLATGRGPLQGYVSCEGEFR